MANLNKKIEMEEIGNTGIIIDKSIKEYLENQTLKEMSIIIDESFYKDLEDGTNHEKFIKFTKKCLKGVNEVRINE